MSMKPAIDSSNTAHVEFLRSNIRGKSYSELAAAFNNRFNTAVSRHTVGNFCRRYRLSDVKPERQRYTVEQIQFLRENVKGRFYKELTELFNEHFNTTATIMAIREACRQFKIPNKMNGGFQEGHTRNTGKGLPDGVENVNIAGYRTIKKDGVWRGKHVVLWEEANGPVPDGHCIVFGDGCKQNLRLDNLFCIPVDQAGIWSKRGLKGETSELAEMGIALAGLYARINEKNKKKEQKKSKT